MNQRVHPRVQNAARKELCVACLQPLSDSKVVRGCHERCYRATVRAINRGDFSEQDRILAGKLLPAKSGGGKPTNPVTVEARYLAECPEDECFCGEVELIPANYHTSDVDTDFDLDFYLNLIQKKIIVVCGVFVELEDLLWHFFRTSHRNMSICTEVIVETANHSGLLSQFTNEILADEPRPKIKEQTRINQA